MSETSEPMDMQQSIADLQDLDRPLFEALSEGDVGALEELMQRHGGWVRGAAFAVLGQSHELDDVVQHVWMTVWRQAHTLDDARVWRYWLYRIARNAALDYGRKRQRRRSLWQGLTRSQAGVRPWTDEDASANLERGEQHGRVMRAIEGLPAIYREPFVLRHLQDLSYREIAQVMGLPLDTVETRLVRARRLLREALEPMRDEDR